VSLAIGQRVIELSLETQSMQSQKGMRHVARYPMVQKITSAELEFKRSIPTC